MTTKEINKLERRKELMMTIKEKHEIINQVYELANAERIEEALNILEKHKQDMPSDDFIALLKKVREASAKNI